MNVLLGRLVALCAHHPWTTVFLSALVALGGALSALRSPLDAIPDLSDPQVIVAAEWMGRSPDLVEDQVTAPLTLALLGTPGVATVRGQSGFGMSFVYVIFGEDTDPAAARVAVSEVLGRTLPRLPDGVEARLGPDASGVGWVFQYALVDAGGVSDPAALRALHDTVIRPALQGVDGVAEVATVGGFERQVEVSLDPARMRAHGVSFAQVADAVASANVLAGGGTMEVAGHEQMLRLRAEARTFDDLLEAPILVDGGAGVTTLGGRGGAAAGGGAGTMAGMGGMEAAPTAAAPVAGPARGGSADALPTPHRIRVRDVAEVQWAAAPRRGVADLDGRGEVVAGIVVARQGQNALEVVDGVRERLDVLAAALPPGVTVRTVYDRGALVREAVATLLRTLLEEMLVVAVVVVVFLRHPRSALVPVVGLPVAVLAAFVPLSAQGLTVNIMSLGGIAVAVGAMVDASILIVENVHARRRRVGVVGAMQEVAPSAFFALLVVTVSFTPVFALHAAEGRLFGPLAWTKSWAMLAAAIAAVTLTPALVALTRQREMTVVAPEAASGTETVDGAPTLLERLYAPLVRASVQHRWLVVGLAGALVVATVPAFLRLPREFMPPLREGSLLYMPTAPPGISEAEAARVLQALDAAVAEIPEVASVFGKIGRADSATDPAPLSMAETVILLKPRDEWREGLTWEGLVAELDAHVRAPGFPNTWWMPVQTRMEMLATGLRSPLGIKVRGPDLAAIETAALALEQHLAAVPGTRSIVAERATGAFVLDVVLRRAEASALGVRAADVAQVVEGALGGRQVGEWFAGRARHPLTVRYARDFRTDPEAVGSALLERPGAAPVALSSVADVVPTTGPDMIRSEDGELVGYVMIDPGERPISAWVADAEARLGTLALGEGVRTEWAGSFQAMNRAEERLAYVLPFTLLVILLLLRINTSSWVETGIVLLAVPFSLVGAVWLVGALGYSVSVATWVGMIALAGLDAETGVVMLLYLSLAWKQRAPGTPMVEVIVHGAARRLRPKLMTVATAMLGLLPVFWSEGAGADVMRRIAAPMVGGLVSSFALELLVYPALFAIWKRWEGRTTPDATSAA